MIAFGGLVHREARLFQKAGLLALRPGLRKDSSPGHTARKFEHALDFRDPSNPSLRFDVRPRCVGLVSKNIASIRDRVRMPPRKQQEKGFDIADFLGTDMSGGRFTYWVWGIACSALIAIYGMKCILLQSAEIVGHRPIRIVNYTGGAAIALGVTYVAVSLFVHLHCCWSEHKTYSGYAEVGKLASIIVIVGGLICFVADVVFLH